MLRRIALLPALALATASFSLASAGAATNWTVTPSPNGTGAQGGIFFGVSCTSASSCVAVGNVQLGGAGPIGTLIESFDGTHWTRQASLNAAGAGTSSLGGVSCVSPNSCLAVGSSGSLGNWGRRLAERWNGSSWSIENTPAPAAATSSAFGGIACASASNCTVVGAWGSGGQPPGTALIEHWNGTSWSIPALPLPPDSSSSLASVSCAGPSECKAVGASTDNNTGNQLPLIESWNGSSWSIDASATLNPPYGATLNSVSCSAPASCMAVGEEPGGGGVLAERWDGSSWEQSSIPLPEPPQGRLSGVSCTSSTSCVAVSGEDFTERYDGSTWHFTQLTDGAGLGAVACTAADNCTAVGDAGVGAGAERWNGSKWSMLGNANPYGIVATVLSGVGCGAAANCVAVGSTASPFALAEHWNGGTWSLTPVPEPSGAVNSSFGSTSCSSTTECVAVGFYAVAPGGDWISKPLAEIWDGSRWAVQNAASPNVPNLRGSSLDAVTCPTASACVAVGAMKIRSMNHPLVERWNGSAWTIQPTPALPAINVGALNGVTCRSSADCIAVGWYGVTTGVRRPLVEHWNGGAWTLQTAASPSQNLSQFDGVACPSTTRCVAVGWSQKNFYESASIVVEQWDGTTWKLQSVPTNGFDAGALAGVTCESAGDCNAAGQAHANAPQSHSEGIVEHWNGTSWSLQRVPLPANHTSAALSAITCVTGTCTAVGESSVFGLDGTDTYVVRSS